MGVATIYKPFFILILLNFFILLQSCAPANNMQTEENLDIDKPSIIEETSKKTDQINNFSNTENSSSNDNNQFNEFSIHKNITIILSTEDDTNVVNQFINIIEFAVYQKNLKNISFEVKLYKDTKQLEDFFGEIDLSGKIFIGPLSTSDTKILNKYCNKGAIFFSFSSNKDLAKDCVYLVNFFPENEIRTVFDYFPNNSKIAFLYPENSYGFGINKIIDHIANQSDSVIVNRASYSEDLSNAPEAIKELGKYELRKYELNRQKKILANKKDADSKKRLIKLERFQTTQNLDFTHVIIADYGLRLLQVAPLLPYYDIDPNIVEFVGTGAWDDEVFYDEPSLDGSIYPGIEFVKRKKLFEEYYNLYNENLLRISTLPYDIVGLISFIIDNNYNLSSFYDLLNKSNTKFSGIDGSFSFLNNIIERDLEILKIENGKAKAVLHQE